MFFNEFFCFSVMMSKKASAGQFSVSGSNLGPNPPEKNDFCYGKDFFLGGSSYIRVFFLKFAFLALNGLWSMIYSNWSRHSQHLGDDT